MTNILKYQGVRKDGTAGTGAVDGHANTPAWIAEQLYDQGWRRATITRDGEHVGAVGQMNGERDWWGECTT